LHHNTAAHKKKRMSQQLGSEVERQGKATTPGTALSSQRKEEELSYMLSMHAKGNDGVRRTGNMREESAPNFWQTDREEQLAQKAAPTYRL
jgi:hypothetical protein